MEYGIIIDAEWGRYLQGIPFFLMGYGFAYVFKNLPRLRERHGMIVFILILIFVFAIMAVMLPRIEYLQSYPVTLAYALGFFFRFFRYDD